MQKGSSATWRQYADAKAFDPRAWEFGARQFRASAQLLIQHHDDHIATPSFEVIMALPTAEFLMSLALELLAKAYYLRGKLGPKEKIYTHEVSKLFGNTLFDPSQQKLMARAERYVVWAGRYPTPKWLKEPSKEEYDVPATIVDGQEQIDATNLPNSSSRGAVNQLVALYDHINAAYVAAA